MPVDFMTCLTSGGSGIDWPAAVSAGAAVIQAVGAVAAIYYSGKLARDAAYREKAANEANERRIAEADEAALHRRMEDRQQQEADRRKQEDEKFNAPIIRVLRFAEASLNEFEIFLATVNSSSPSAQLRYNQKTEQIQFIEKATAVSDEVYDPAVAAAIRNLITSLEPFPAATTYFKENWAGALQSKVERAKADMATLEAMKRDQQVSNGTPGLPPIPAPPKY